MNAFKPDNSTWQGRPKKGRKRKIADQSRVDRKRFANNNKRYVNTKGNVVEEKVFNEGFVCGCTKTCTEKVGTELRKKLFRQFWSIGSYEGRCALIVGCVTQNIKKRTYTKSNNSRRNFTRKYTIFGKEVCKPAFLKSLQISESRVDLALYKQEYLDTYADGRGKLSGGRNAMALARRHEVCVHIESFPKYVSHYCRKETSAKYLNSDLTVSKMYELYKETHENPVSLSSYNRIFLDNFNLRFKTLKKDTCSKCDYFVAMKTRTTSSEKIRELDKEHQKHLAKAEALQNQMKADLNSAKTDEKLEAASFDIEKTLAQPKLTTNVAYYKRQLNLYNLGIHIGSTGKGIFNIWQENEAGKGRYLSSLSS